MKQLVRATLKTGGGTIAKLLFGMIAVKLIAVVSGPSGVGLFSLLRQIRDTAMNFATCNGTNALVQGIASRDDGSRHAYIRAVFFVFLFLGILASGVLVVLAPLIAQSVFGDQGENRVTLVRWLALPLFIGTWHVFLKGILNGYSAVGRLAVVDVVMAGCLAVLAFPAARMASNGIEVAFVWMMAVAGGISLLVSLFFLHRAGWLSPVLGISVSRKERTAAWRHFFSISGTMLFTGLIVTSLLLAVRGMVTHRFGLEGAGIFDVAWTISMMYVGIIAHTFGTYYLPTLAGIKDKDERNALIQQVFHLSTLLMLPVIVAVISMKPLVVSLLYSEEFLPALDIIRWMLIGDYFKISAFVLAFPMLAYADMWVFLWSEVIFIGLQAVGAYISVMYWGHLEGIGMTFLIVYAAYFVFTMGYCYRRFDFLPDGTLFSWWMVGLLLVVLVSVVSWHQSSVAVGSTAMWLIAACLASWMMLNRNERMWILKRL